MSTILQIFLVFPEDLNKR